MRKSFIILCAGLFALIACAKKVTVPTLRVDIGAEITSFDPVIPDDGTSFRVINDLFAGLVDFDRMSQPIPGMAESWNISLDGKTYTFHLRPNLKFSDGSPITAADFVFSWQRLVNPRTGSPFNFLLKDVVNASQIINGKLPETSLAVSAPNNNTFIVKLSHPTNAFITYITSPSTFVISQKAVTKYGNTWTEPNNIVTSGAYSLKQHVQNGYILAVKNHFYYAESQVTIPQIKFLRIIDNNTSLNAFKTNGLDTTWQNIPTDQYEKYKQEYPNELYTWPWERNEFLHLNLRLEKYKNPKLRQALSMAIDRQVLTRQVLKAGQIPLYTIVTPTIENGKYADITYPWSEMPNEKRISEAQELYNQAGYSKLNPLTVTISYRNNEIYKKVALAIASMWQQNLGIKVNIQTQDWKSLTENMHKGDFDIVERGGWGADYNLVTTYTSLQLCDNGNNYTGYCNSLYDKLIYQADLLANPIEQKQLYTQAINLALNDYAIIPLYEPTHQNLVKSRVEGFVKNPLYNFQSKWFSLKH